jgi:hypothetical protein
VPPQLGGVFGALLLLTVLSAMSLRRFKVQWAGRRTSPASAADRAGET